MLHNRRSELVKRVHRKSVVTYLFQESSNIEAQHHRQLCESQRCTKRSKKTQVKSMNAENVRSLSETRRGGVGGGREKKAQE